MSTHPSPATQPKLYIFECNSETYLTCMEKGLFGSNKNWPLAVKKGDFCLLHHLEAGTLLGLWKTASDGGRHLDARLSPGSRAATDLKLEKQKNNFFIPAAS